MEHARAFEIANRIITSLEPFCERIVVAGSVRRGKPDVKDIEILAKPFSGITDLGGNLVPADVDVSSLGRVLKNGPKYKQIALSEGINLDLFLVTPPAQWGVLLAIRTGPADFSKRLVSIRRFGGYLPSWAKVKDGAVWHSKGDLLLMPEEKDFFEFCGLPLILPVYRESCVGKSWLSMMSRQPS
jgi:DNA polymerase/3'-5' exonuclease PolX